MKIDIITFHFVHNHGALLQCYALQTYLSIKGYDVRVIDYRPSYHVVRYSAYKNPFLYARMFFYKSKNKKMLARLLITIRSFLRCLILNISRTDAYSEVSFSAFRDKNLKLTKEYKTLKDLKNAPPVADVYITGSDQLWNPDILYRDFDEAYFLDFGDSSIKRISYAVSLKKNSSDEELNRIKELSYNLDAVSIREHSAKIEKSLNQKVEVCLDPTLLLSRNEFECIQGLISENEPYIFVYGLETTKSICEAVSLAVDKYHCKIINGSPHRVKLGIKSQNVYGFGPDKFLAYIANATCVVTNSFHGTAISIIYKKNFVTVAHSTNGYRMTELLQKLGLNQCLWNDNNFSIEKPIDWNIITSNLEKLKKKSEEFLLYNIESDSRKCC